MTKTNGTVLRVLRRALPLLVAGGIFYLSHQPSLDFVPPLFPHQDKVFHMTEYFIFFVSMFINRDICRCRRPTALIYALGALYALSDEFHQSFIPGRDCSLGDFLADLTGLAIGLTVCLSYMRRHRGTA